MARVKTPLRESAQAARSLPTLDVFETAQFGSIADRLAEKFGTRGLPITLSTACASGATAIQLGVEAIRRGEADRALSIGADGSATAEALIRFSLLSALSTNNGDPEKASKPFSKDRDGFVLAEGSAALVLELLESAVARGATILGILQGCGERADDFHRTRSKPDGSPAIAAVRAALADAGLDEDGISYVNAHGTSTPENDKMEHLSLSTVFGERMRKIPVSSNKSMIGHTLSAAGAIEAAFSLLTIRDGVIPPTINYDHPDPADRSGCGAECEALRRCRHRVVQFLRLRRSKYLSSHGAGASNDLPKEPLHARLAADRRPSP